MSEITEVDFGRVSEDASRDVVTARRVDTSLKRVVCVEEMRSTRDVQAASMFDPASEKKDGIMRRRRQSQGKH